MSTQQLVVDTGGVLTSFAAVFQQGSRQSKEYSLYKDLHASTQAQDQVKGGLLLDVVVGQGATVLKLLASKDEALLVWGDAFLVLDLGLHILDGV